MSKTRHSVCKHLHFCPFIPLLLYPLYPFALFTTHVADHLAQSLTTFRCVAHQAPAAAAHATQAPLRSTSRQAPVRTRARRAGIPDKLFDMTGLSTIEAVDFRGFL